MGQRLEKKVALITGGTSGIGEATAELFAAEGAKVVFTGRSEEKGACVAERLGDNAVYLKADVMEEEDIEASVNFTVERYGKLDVLLAEIDYATFDLDAAVHFGRVRNGLESHGTPIGPYDMMIAAHALSLNAVLVTDNVREFRRVEDLEIENWRR